MTHEAERSLLVSQDDRLTSVKRRLTAAFEIPATIAVFVLMLQVAVNAIFRTFGLGSIPDTLELTQYWYLPIVALLGFIVAESRGEHMVADLIYENFDRSARRIVKVLSASLGAVVSLGFAWFGLSQAIHAMNIGLTAGSSDIPAWPVQFLVPIVFTVFFIQFVWSGIRAFGADVELSEEEAMYEEIERETASLETQLAEYAESDSPESTNGAGR